MSDLTRPSKSEMFHEATVKNALRRESGLPLIDIRADLAKQTYAAAIAHYNEGFKLHRDQFAKIKDDVLADLQREHGPDYGRGRGGQMVVGYRALTIYRDFLAARGYPFPENPKTIVYAEDRDSVEKVERGAE